MPFLNLIRQNTDVALIGLNPTKDAITKKSVFSRDNAFWNLLVRAELLKASILQTPLQKRAQHAFMTNAHSVFIWDANAKRTRKLTLGFADLLPFTVETDSRNVHIPTNAVSDFFALNPHAKDVKRMGLMGEKVVNAFAHALNLKTWNALPINPATGEKSFGKIGEISFRQNHEYCVFYALPFPVNTAIKEKHIYYKLLL